MFTCNDHTFVVCAYGESPYLSDCISSLMNQKQASRILISTSTPNKHIEQIASSYNLPVFINNGMPELDMTGIVQFPMRNLHWSPLLIKMTCIP